MSAIENEFEYDASLMRCHSCATGARAAQAYQQSGGKLHGIHVSITKRG